MITENIRINNGLIMEEDTEQQEMEKWFHKRTDRHIKLVQKYCNKIYEHDKQKFKGIIERGKQHDASKYEEPEYEPYIYITWQYKHKNNGEDYAPPENMKEKMHAASEHHVKHNQHHPEYYDNSKKELINKKNRDLPPEEMIDATKMSDLDIAEMVADWMAMSEELGDNPVDWANKNVNKRWKFNDGQQKLIYELLELY